MTDKLRQFSEEDLSILDSKLWRRLHITQTFDQMLVAAAAVHPGAVAEVGERVGRSFQGGAARFWEMSFPKTLRELRRREVLAEASGQLSLHVEFAERLQELLDGQREGHSRIAPTPGATLEAVLRHQEERRKQAEVEKRGSARPATPRKPTPRKSRTSSAAPAKRSSKGSTHLAATLADTPAPAPARLVLTPAAKLFTSQRLNRMLDALDPAALTVTLLGRKLSISGPDLQRFVSVCDAVGLTRTNEGMVELHWQGRELARTQATDRRMALREAIKQLRSRASEDAD